MAILYFFIRLFVKVMVRIFFRDVTVIGAENLPQKGPVVICATHNNQFVDALMLIYAINRPINFVIAASSARLPYLKIFTRALGFISTERPIDHKKNGTGLIKGLAKEIMEGVGTKFTAELSPGCTVKPKAMRDEFIVQKVIDDTHVQVTSASEAEGEPEALAEPTPFLVMPKLDQKKVFQQVADTLRHDGVIGVFPEGGSHDQTKLLPLKAGACVFVWSAHAELNKNPSVICTGINYFDASKFRSKVIVKISKPMDYDIDPARYGDREYKRKKIADMLVSLRDSMEEVKFLAPSYKELLNLNLAGQLYTPADKSLTKEEQFKLYKKFCNGYENVKDLAPVKELVELIEVFRQKLKSLGLTVRDLRDPHTRLRIDVLLVLKLIARLVVGLPFLLFMFPIRQILSAEAEKKRKKALSGSYVKVKGTDVMASWKIILSCVLVPLFLFIWQLLYYLVARFYFHAQRPFYQSVVFLFLFPLYLYMAVYLFDGIERQLKVLYANVANIVLTKIDKKDRLKELIEQSKVLEKQLLSVISSNMPLLKEELRDQVVGRFGSVINYDRRISELIDEM